MNFIEDNLKKESKRVLLTFILCYIVALIFPLLYYIDYDMETVDNFNWSAFAKKDESITVNMNQDFSYIANETFPHECGHVYDWSQSK